MRLCHEDCPCKIGFQEYIHWTLQYHDKWFQKHHSFPFITFSIQQKQSALLLARIHMCQKDFKADTDLLAELSLHDLQEAQIDEQAHWPIQNEHVQWLCHHLYATNSHIMALGKMCSSYWSQIWGTCLWLRLPSIWLTINLMNYEDPIAQIFTGQNINMNAFLDIVGPDSNEHAKNMVSDPFASATFFNFIVHMTLENYSIWHSDFKVSCGQLSGNFRIHEWIFWHCGSAGKRVIAHAYVAMVEAHT